MLYVLLVTSNMSVDKFGRYETSVLRSKMRGPPGMGFKTTADGDYDMQSKRLRMVGDPTDVNDAVTVNFVNEKCLQLKKTKTDNKNRAFFDVGKRGVIRHLNEPVEPTDAVTKSYVDKRTPLRKKDEWDFSEMRLSNVAEPKLDNDSVNLTFLKNNVLIPLQQNKPLLLNKNNEYDAKGKCITNVLDAVVGTDVVNLQLLNAYRESVNKEFHDIWIKVEDELSNMAHMVVTRINDLQRNGSSSSTGARSTKNNVIKKPWWKNFEPEEEEEEDEGEVVVTDSRYSIIEKDSP